jgi:hypothetical protein
MRRHDAGSNGPAVYQARAPLDEFICVDRLELYLFVLYVGPKVPLAVGRRAVPGVSREWLVADAIVHCSVGQWELCFELNIFHYVLDMWVSYLDYI